MSRRNRSDSGLDAEGVEGSPEGGSPELPGFTVEELQPGEAIAPATEAPLTPESKAPTSYVVAPGRSLTVKRGHLGEGAPVRATDLSLEQVRDLIVSGHLVAK